jgi:2'-hydroxyisoflavone reductase
MQPTESLDILVLGGTGYIGPHMVREALARGHTVSLFNRGRTNSNLFPDLTKYVGDRDNGLDSLEGGKWDAVIDNSGYVPRHVEDSARLLKSAISQYLYVSSISVYADFSKPLDESSPVATIEDESTEEITNESYGPLKALCEDKVRAVYDPDQRTILRPTYICGPGDKTDRFTYWPVRTAMGGEMLWPGTPEDNIQIVDVRDLARFTVDCLEQRITGTYNTVNPAGGYTIGKLHDECMQIMAAEDTSATWVSAEFLEANDASFSMPIWLPNTGEYADLAMVSGEKAAAAGLHSRPERETARDALSWWNHEPPERTEKLRAGPGLEREGEMLELWKIENS